MKEIKFRAWDEEWRAMSSPMELFKNGQSFFFFKGFGTRSPNHEKLKVMQFTGLHDKNGKEIYEGDILFCNGIESIEVCKAMCGFRASYKSQNCRKLYIVEWSSPFASWTFKAITPRSRVSIDINARDYEVIGNIYENPELLGAV